MLGSDRSLQLLSPRSEDIDSSAQLLHGHPPPRSSSSACMPCVRHQCGPSLTGLVTQRQPTLPSSLYYLADAVPSWVGRLNLVVQSLVLSLSRVAAFWWRRPDAWKWQYLFSDQHQMMLQLLASQGFNRGPGMSQENSLLPRRSIAGTCSVGCVESCSGTCRRYRCDKEVNWAMSLCIKKENRTVQKREHCFVL